MEKSYSNGEIIVFWKPELCWHAAMCVKGLPDVFNTNRRPWIDLSKADTQEIMRVVDLCPSGALSWIKEK